MYKRKLTNTFETEISNKRAKTEINIKRAKRLLEWARQFPIKNWYIPKKLTRDGFFSAYGPRNGILFVGDDNTDEITETENVLNKLKLVFNEGINHENCLLSAAEYIPYFSAKYAEYLIQGDVTKEQASNLADEYSFIYVIDASKESNLTSFPAFPGNTNNLKFFYGAPFDRGINQKLFFIIPSSLKPQAIVGAFATEALAHSLDISEKTLIVNPKYEGNFPEIKNKLKINEIKELKDCQLTAFDYESAIKAYSAANSFA